MFKPSPTLTPAQTPLLDHPEPHAFSIPGKIVAFQACFPLDDKTRLRRKSALIVLDMPVASLDSGHHRARETVAHRERTWRMPLAATLFVIFLELELE